MAGRHGTAVLLIDVINTFDFPNAAPLIREAKRVAPHIERVVRRARESNIPVIYVNDNFGRWASDFNATLAECVRPSRPGRAVCQRLQPQKGDYFILKPQHSGFYATPLDLLLTHLGAHTLVLTGFASNLCVLFTANDAHMHGYHLVVPSDACAANTRAWTRTTLAHVRVALGGLTPPSTAVDFEAFRGRRRKPRGQAF